MPIPDPKKKLNKVDPANNYMIIKMNLGYDQSLVLPYQDGIQLMAALQNARAYKEEYQKESLIFDIKAADIRTGVIGEQEYGEGLLRSTLLAEDKNSS